MADDIFKHSAYDIFRDTVYDSFKTGAASSITPWLGDWAKRRKIIIDHTNVDSDLLHFPVAVPISASAGQGSQNITDIFTEIGANYKKIAITLDDGTTEIFAQVESWDSVAEVALLWVSRSDFTVTSTATTDLYIYFDSTKADNSYYIGKTTEEYDITSLVTGDDFTGTDGAVPDQTLWREPNEDLWAPDLLYPFTTGVELEGGRLKMSQTDNNAFFTFANLNSKFWISGDFDIQVDIDVSDWVNSTGPSKEATLYLWASEADRISWRFDGDTGFDANLSVSNVWDGAVQPARTNDFGKLRLIRTGTSVEFQYQDGAGSWTTAATKTFSAIDVMVSLFARFEDEPFETFFDNFTINSADKVYIVPSEQIWEKDFRSVYTLAQDPDGDVADSIKDSAWRRFHGTPVGSMTTGDFVAGSIDGKKGIALDGVDDCISIPFGTNVEQRVTKQYSYAALAYHDDWNQNFSNKKLMSCIETGGFGFDFDSSPNDIDNIAYINGAYRSAEFEHGSLSPGWHLFYSTYDGAKTSLIVDGNLEDTYVVTGDLSYSNETTPLVLGAEAGTTGPTGDYWVGALGWHEVSAKARSLDWIKAFSHNILESIVTYDAQESLWLDGWSDRLKISVDSSKIDADLAHFPIQIAIGESSGSLGQNLNFLLNELEYWDVDDVFTGTDDDPPNSDLWSLSGTQRDPYILSNSLRTWLEATSSDLQKATSIWRLSGDFDIQADFNLISQPISGVRWTGFVIDSVGTTTGQALILRRYDTGEQYAYNQSVSGSWGTLSTTGTTDSSGQLRVTRVGSTLTSYFWSGSSWTQIDSRSWVSDDVKMALGSQTNVAQSYTADFDNFVINSGTIIWPSNTNPNRKRVAFTDGYRSTPMYTEIETFDQSPGLLSAYFFGSNRHGDGGIVSAYGTPTDNGDYYTFDGSTNGLYQYTRTDEQNIAFEVKFRAHNKGAGNQILFKSGGEINGIAVGIDSSGNLGIFGRSSSTLTSIVIASTEYLNNVWYILRADKTKIQLLDAGTLSVLATTVGTITNGDGSADVGVAFASDGSSPISGVTPTVPIEFFDGDIAHVKVFTYDENNFAGMSKAVFWVSRYDLTVLSSEDSELFMYYDSTQEANKYIGDVQEIIDVSSEISGDTFQGVDGDAPDVDLWSQTWGTPTISSNALAVATTGGLNGISSIFRLLGDFDVQIDFGMDAIPSTTSWSITLRVQAPDTTLNNRFTVSRRYDGTHRYTSYETDGGVDGSSTVSNSSDTSGKLRIVRTGDSFTGYFWNGTSWTALGTDTVSGFSGEVADIRLYLTCWGSNPSVSGYFDSLVINSGTVIDCPSNHVWDDNFKAIYHMSQDPDGDAIDSIFDSTRNRNHGTPNGSMTSDDLIYGEIGKAIEFDGTDDDIEIADNSDLRLTDMTLTIRMKVPDITRDTRLLSKGRLDSVDPRNYYLYLTASKINFGTEKTGDGFEGLAGATTLLSDTWYNFDGRVDSLAKEIFVDGVSDGTSVVTSLNQATSPVRIGSVYNSTSDTMLGSIAFVGISNVGRSDAWVKAFSYVMDDALISFDLGTVDALQDFALDIQAYKDSVENAKMDMSMALDSSNQNVVLDLSSYFESLTNFKSDFNIIGNAFDNLLWDVTLGADVINDFKTDLQVYFQSLTETKLDLKTFQSIIETLPIDFRVAVEVREDGKLDINAALRSFDDLKLAMVLTQSIIDSDCPFDLSVGDGIIYKDNKMDLEVSDGNKKENLGLSLTLVAPTPVFRAIYGIHLESAIKDVT